MLTPEVMEVRWQSGFFNEEPLGLFAPTLSRLAKSKRTVHVLIGSNAPGTQRDDVIQLVQLVGLPRQGAQVGVVQFSNAFFHPKTYHFRRADGSQCAYVGSANLTAQGASSLHVEAGITVDTRDGDPVVVLDDIANAVDSWFVHNREGLNIIADPADVGQLVTEGVLILAPPLPPSVPPAVASSSAGAGGASGGAARPPRLSPLVNLPSLPGPPSVVGPPPPMPVLPSVNRAGFPVEILFDANATGPTTGSTALSGHALSGGAVGLIVRLSKDDTRIFGSQVGTANINLPVNSMATLRFGVLGRSTYPNRPRAEFDLYVRYLGRTQNFVLPDPAETNVMLYGYLPGESGHQNRRMLLPADVRGLGDQVALAGLPVPTVGHLALLEWPTHSNPDFRLSFLEPRSKLAKEAQKLFNAAVAAQQMLADNACGFQAGVSPPW
jgi:hypothetical protein